MAMRRRIVVIIAIGTLVGCYAGARPQYKAGGVETTVTTNTNAVIQGELLALSADHLVLVDGGRNLYRIYYGAIASGRFQGAGTLIRYGQPPNESAQSLLRALSAFPQGMSDSLLARVRAAFGSGAPNVIRQ
jgi:hypothetical protein